MTRKNLLERLKKNKLVAFDFDGVFTDGKVIVDQNGIESVVCSRKDTLRMKELKNIGIRLVVISKEKNPIIQKRCEKMEVEFYQGVDNKIIILKKFLEENNILPHESSFVGDDINDVDCLKYLHKARGITFTVADGHRQCKKWSNYVTSKKGGDHAVREICDLILEAKGGLANE